MKKNIKRLCLLIIVLAVISTTVILLFGKTYEVKFTLNGKENFQLNFEEGSDLVEILEERKRGNYYIVKLKAKKPGNVFLTLDFHDFYKPKSLYIHKSLVITDNNFFGKSTASEVIPISFLIILGYILYLLIKKYRYMVKNNLYQYKNVTYLGIIIFVLFFAFNNIISFFNYQGLLNTINTVINSISSFSIILFPIIVITFSLVTISNIRLIIKEGKSLKNFLGVFLGIFICFSTVLPDFVYSLLLKAHFVNINNLNSPGPYLYNFFETLIYLSITYLECILIATIIIAFKSIHKKIAYDKDYVVILGCQIKKDGTLTPLLKGRVDRAIKFRNEQLEKNGKDLIFVPTGGKGSDEIISEASAMKNYLIKEGILKNNILVEDKAKNTDENIKFSNKLINNKNAKIIFSTNNYHVFRAGLLATNQGLKWEGIGSKTKAYFWINAFIREFIGTLYSERKRHMIMFAIILFFILIIISFTYLANNI